MTGRVLVSVSTHAVWSGLHENIWASLLGVRERGFQPTLVCSPGRLVTLADEAGIPVRPVQDWDRWSEAARDLAREPWDLVHCHPFAGRKLGATVAKTAGLPLVASFHGYYEDRVDRWHHLAKSVVAVSRAHAGMLVRLGVPSPKVHVVPNAVADEHFDREVVGWEEKVADGTADVVVASRLDPDKKWLGDALAPVVEAASRLDRRLRWRIQVAGDGRAAETMTAELSRLASRRVDLDLVGWVDPEEVARRMSRAVLTVASGRGAQLSLAVGTPTVAFGSKGVYGLQHGPNLRVGLWGNFGGHPLDGIDVTPVGADVTRLLSDRDHYAHVVAHGREVASRLLRQSHADEALAGIYRA